MTFRVGQKVVCVDACFVEVPNIPTLGAVYTIREIFVNFGCPIRGGCGVYVEEITNPIHQISGMEYGFYSFHFRPIVERKTSIEIFTAMLKPTKVDA